MVTSSIQPTVRVKILHHSIPLPTYATRGSAGIDLYSRDGYILRPGEWCIVGSGIAVSIPEGYEMQIRSRSGRAAKEALVVLNQPGTIDSDYRGEVKVLLINLGKDIVHIRRWDRVAQGIVCPIVRPKFELVEDLDVTERGQGGLGSTGH